MRACGAGGAHGPTYRIADFDSACMDSAKAQVMILRKLLGNDAARAKDVVAKAKPYFASREAYVAYLDLVFTETDAVEYAESGNVLLHLTRENAAES